MLQSNTCLFLFGIRALLAFDSSSSSSSSIKVCMFSNQFVSPKKKRKKHTTTPYPLLLFLPCQMLIIFSPLKLPTTIISTEKSYRFLVLKVQIFLVSLMVPTYALQNNVSIPWTKQDQHLKSLLISFLSDEIVPLVVSLSLSKRI